MIWLQNNSLYLILVSLISSFCVLVFYISREVKISKRVFINYNNYQIYKDDFNVNTNKVINTLGLIFIFYNILLIIMSAFSNVTKINIIVYAISLIINVILVVGNSTLKKHNKKLDLFSERYIEINQVKEEYNNNLKICKKAEDKYKALCVKYSDILANNEIKGLIKYNHKYVDDELLSLNNTILNAKEAVNISIKDIESDFTDKLHQYITNGTNVSFEINKLNNFEQKLQTEISDVDVKLQQYIQDETCKQLNITINDYQKLFGHYNSFVNPANAIENMYVVLQQYDNKYSGLSIKNSSNRKEVEKAYQIESEKISRKANQVLKMLLLYNKSISKDTKLIDIDSTINYYLQAKANFELDSLTILIELLALLILEYETDTTIFDNVIKTMKDFGEKDINKIKLKNKLCSKKYLPKLARVLANIEVERCTLDKIINL